MTACVVVARDTIQTPAHFPTSPSCGHLVPESTHKPWTGKNDHSYLKALNGTVLDLTGPAYTRTNSNGIFEFTMASFVHTMACVRVDSICAGVTFPRRSRPKSLYKNMTLICREGWIGRVWKTSKSTVKKN